MEDSKIKPLRVIIGQALLFTLVLTFSNTLITYFGDTRNFADVFFRWITVIQFLSMALIWGLVFYFRNERIKKDFSKKL